MAPIIDTQSENEISSSAKSCPGSECPAKPAVQSGIVKIKVSAIDIPIDHNTDQRVSIFSDTDIIWRGDLGDIAELYVAGATRITVKYHMSLFHPGGKCSGVIDPAQSDKYIVSVRQGVSSAEVVLQPVDVFDMD